MCTFHHLSPFEYIVLHMWNAVAKWSPQSCVYSQEGQSAVLADCLVLQSFVTPLLEQPGTEQVIPVSAPRKSLTSSSSSSPSIPHVHGKPCPSPHLLLLGEDEMEINTSLQWLMMRPSWVSLSHQLLLQFKMNTFLSK